MTFLKVNLFLRFRCSEELWTQPKIHPSPPADAWGHLFHTSRGNTRTVLITHWFATFTVVDTASSQPSSKPKRVKASCISLRVAKPCNINRAHFCHCFSFIPKKNTAWLYLAFWTSHKKGRWAGFVVSSSNLLITPSSVSHSLCTAVNSLRSEFFGFAFILEVSKTPFLCSPTEKPYLARQQGWDRTEHAWQVFCSCLRILQGAAHLPGQSSCAASSSVKGDQRFGTSFVPF